MSPYREQHTLSEYALTATAETAADGTHQISAVPKHLWRITDCRPPSEQEHLAADTFPQRDHYAPTSPSRNEIVCLRALLLTCEEERIARLEAQVADLMARAGAGLNVPLLPASERVLATDSAADDDSQMTMLRLLVFATERQRIAQLETQVAALRAYIEPLDTTLPPMAAAAVQARNTLPPFENERSATLSPEIAQLRKLLLKSDHWCIIDLEAQVVVLRERFDAYDARISQEATDAQPVAKEQVSDEAADETQFEVVEPPALDSHLLAHLLERQSILRYTVPAASRLATYPGEIIACTLKQPDQPAAHQQPNTQLLSSDTAPPATHTEVSHTPSDNPQPHDEDAPHTATVPDADAAPSGSEDAPTYPSPSGHTNGHHPVSDENELERLRTLLIEPERQRLAFLESQLANLRQQVDDSDIDYEVLYASLVQNDTIDAYGHEGDNGTPEVHLDHQERDQYQDPAPLPELYHLDDDAAGGPSLFTSDMDLLIDLLDQQIPLPDEIEQPLHETAGDIPALDSNLARTDSAQVLQPATDTPQWSPQHSPNKEEWQKDQADEPVDTQIAVLAADIPPPDAPTLARTGQGQASLERSPTDQSWHQSAVQTPQPARQERLVVRVARLEAEIAAMHQQLDDRDALIAMLAPVISLIIAERVRNSRDEMAEALYPVIGKTIGKAVTEALRDLARRVDSSVRSTTNVKQVFTRWRMRMQGVDPQSSALRALLPFRVQEIFLIHIDSGLLMQHISNTNTLTDADLISGMLTAIRSYVKDSFVYKDGSLDEITYGEYRILMEEGTLAILAIVIQGNEPGGFRSRMRTQLTELHLMCGSNLRTFTGDPVDEQEMIPFLKPLLESPDDTA